MISINTSEDIIRALERDPRLLSQVRRAIMTDETLALPERFTAMLDVQNRMLAEIAQLKETQNRMLETQNGMLAEIAQLKETQNGILETQNGMLAEIAQLKETQNGLLAEVAQLKETQNGILETQNGLLAEVAQLKETQNGMLAEIAQLKETQNGILETQNGLLAEVAQLKETQNGMLAEIAQLKETQNGILETQNGILETQNEMLKTQNEFRATQNEILEKIAELSESQSEMKTTQNKLLETQNELLRRMANLETRFQRQEHDYRNFKGNYAVIRANDYVYLIAMSICDIRFSGTMYENLKILSKNELVALITVERLSALPRETRESFIGSDIAVEMTRADGETHYMMVEVSYTCDERDATRAIAHGRLLAEATGRDVFPAITGVRYDRRIQPLIDSESLYWYQLKDKYTEPDEVC